MFGNKLKVRGGENEVGFFLWITVCLFPSLSSHTHHTHTHKAISLCEPIWTCNSGSFTNPSVCIMKWLKSLLIHSIHSQTNFLFGYHLKATVLFPWLFNIISHGQKVLFLWGSLKCIMSFERVICDTDLFDNYVFSYHVPLAAHILQCWSNFCWFPITISTENMKKYENVVWIYSWVKEN